jgi:hypothetical protein
VTGVGSTLAQVLKRIEIRNFRALERVDVELDGLTALIGPNGTGKSSILRAIDTVLGSAWPSLRSFLIPQDFTAEDTTRELRIEVELDPPYRHEDKLKTIHQIRRIRVRCLPYKRRTGRAEAGDLHVDLTPLDANGETPLAAVEFGKDRRPIHRPLTVGTEMREHDAVLFIDHRRSLAQHQPWARGSLLARLLAPVRKELPRSSSRGARATRTRSRSATRLRLRRCVRLRCGRSSRSSRRRPGAPSASSARRLPKRSMSALGSSILEIR